MDRTLLDARNYQVNDLGFSEFGDFGEMVNPFHVPPRAVADAYIKSYFSTIHPFFPILLGPVFLDQYQSFWQTAQSPTGTHLWLTIMNLVFALGALHSHLVDPQWVDSSDRTHVLYFVRAKLLAPEPLSAIDIPTIERVQVASLNGMYLVATCQFNR